MSGFFHDGQIGLQIEMGSRRIASRLADTRRRSEFNDIDFDIISRAPFIFISTCGPDGTLDCSIKCGHEGFVQLQGSRELVIPDYDGNGMFRTLGNIRAYSKIALLFVEFNGQKRKLRIHGFAKVSLDKKVLARLKSAQAAVTVTVTDIFPNCPRYLPSMQLTHVSEFVDALGRSALEPNWKEKPDLKDFVHERKAF